jgi:hypothetical protein
VAATGEFRWPPLGRITWPPSFDFDDGRGEGISVKIVYNYTGGQDRPESGTIRTPSALV